MSDKKGDAAKPAQHRLADLKANQGKLSADVTPNAEETARLLAQLEANRRRQEVETLARRLASDVEFGRAVFAELARIDPQRFRSLSKL